MKKNGFTLVELLAVIAILAILVIIAMPNVLDMFNKAKKDSFETEIRTIIKTVEKQWISDSMGKPGVNETIYCRVDGVDCENSLKMDGNKDIDYYVKVDSQGNIVQLGATNDEYQFNSDKKGLKADDDISSDVVSDLDKDDILKITSSGVVIKDKIIGEDNNSLKLMYNEMYSDDPHNYNFAVVFLEDGSMLYTLDGNHVLNGSYEYKNNTIYTLEKEFKVSNGGKTISYYENNTLKLELRIYKFVGVNSTNTNNATYTDYKYPIDMTWEQFVNSEYNANTDFKIENGIVYTKACSFSTFSVLKYSNGNEVKATDIINYNEEYYD